MLENRRLKETLVNYFALRCNDFFFFFAVSVLVHTHTQKVSNTWDYRYFMEENVFSGN